MPAAVAMAGNTEQAAKAAPAEAGAMPAETAVVAAEATDR